MSFVHVQGASSLFLNVEVIFKISGFPKLVR